MDINLIVQDPPIRRITHPQIPAIGEHIALESSDPIWYRVTMVVHCTFKEGCDAEVWAVAVDNRLAKLDGYNRVRR
jgi:hypothetical protein